MLPAAHRLTEGEGFRAAVRAGRRAGTPTLVVHLLLTEGSADSGAAGDPEAPARAGFVVSRAVGNAVVRNRVRRRLRHLVRAHLSALPSGAVLVVRALPAAASASSTGLAADLDRGLARVAAATEGRR